MNYIFVFCGQQNFDYIENCLIENGQKKRNMTEIYCVFCVTEVYFQTNKHCH